MQSLEEENLSEGDWTDFTSLTENNLFQVRGQHIYEMRSSIEKLLVAFGVSKLDFFNSDEDGNHISSPAGDKGDWTDPISDSEDLKSFQVKYIHIEDLRHAVHVTQQLIERWNPSVVGVLDDYAIWGGDPHNPPPSGIMPGPQWAGGITSWTGNWGPGWSAWYLNFIQTLLGNLQAWKADNFVAAHLFDHSLRPGEYFVAERQPSTPISSHVEIQETGNNKFAYIYSQGGIGYTMLKQIGNRYRGIGMEMEVPTQNLFNHLGEQNLWLRLNDKLRFTMDMRADYQRGWMGYISHAEYGAEPPYTYGPDSHNWLWRYPQIKLIVKFRVTNANGLDDFNYEWQLFWDTPMEIGGFYNPPYEYVPAEGTLYYPLQTQETRNVTSIPSGSLITYKLDFWNDLVLYWFNNNTYWKWKDDAHTEKIPCDWSISDITLEVLGYATGGGSSGAGFDWVSFDEPEDPTCYLSWDNIGLERKP